MAGGAARRPHRRADLADGDLRLLSGVCRICRKQQPVGAGVRGHDPGDRNWNHRIRLPCTIRARYRHQYAGSHRSRAGAPRIWRCTAFENSRGTALSPRRRGVDATEPWQPCRRTRDLADAGPCARSRGYVARGGEPRRQSRDAGTPDAFGHLFAQLQPLRQLWRSDIGHPRQGRHSARGDGR
jgi:hypothetical protein